MKKQIITLTMCLALTSTAALASGVNTIGQKMASQPVVSTPTTLNTAKPAATSTIGKPGKQLTITSMDEIKKHFEDRRIKERETLYNNLNLSEEQKIKAKDLDATTKVEFAKYRKKIQIEAKKLRDLKVKHASIFKIYKQKSALNRAKADTKRYIESSRKSFEAILTKEQKTKFKTIENAKKKEIEQFKKGHKNCKRECSYFGPHGMHTQKQVESSKPIELKSSEPIATPPAVPEQK